MRGTERESKECHMKAEAESGIMHLQAKQHQGLLGTTRTRKRQEKNSFLGPSERAQSCQHLGFRLLASRAVERIHFCRLPPRFAVRGNLLQQS